ncbi:GBF-interacting protein 1 [Sesamum angolense]|uniref:GBF-interacting protein 1 n=1 Tax=Sesamum angolense TaxID=2727404 RepID=A0AAE2BU02_9LAMI|nr:GBF-interacting protein 1 [Sesamum angolense]
MSSGVKGGASRVSIPSGVKKTIEDIKEFTGQNHSEDEIYAMLKECSMDPNETTQKLLLLDTFHEVKRKRDRRKENLNKEPAELKWKPGTQARANRVGRGNYSSRYVSHDAGGGRSLAAVKENASSHVTEKGTSKASSATSQDMRKNETSSVTSATTAVSNGASGISSQNANVIHDNHTSAGGGVNQFNTTTIMSKSEGPPPLTSSIDLIKNLNAPGTKDIQQQKMLEMSNSASSLPSSAASGPYFSSSDPGLLPSQDSPVPGPVGTLQCATAELVDDNPTERKSASPKISISEAGIPNLQQKMPNDFQGVGKNPHLESAQTASSTVGVPTVSRPSSNYNNRSQVIGPQKAGPGKEWKPKSTNPNIGQAAATAASSDVSTVSVGSHPESHTTPVAPSVKEATLELQRKLEESHISDRQHVIIPDHLHVPEVEKLGFCFGSFDASFGLDLNQNGVRGSDKSPPLSESSEAIDEPVKEIQLSNQNAFVATEDAETKYPDHPQSPSQGPENFPSSEGEVSSSITPDYSESKPEVASHQNPVVHTTSNYNFGFMPPILSGPVTPLESSESQARDAPRLPGFVVPQSFDPATYYAQFYRSGLDSDGRISPFHAAGAANKYNGNTALVSAQTSQTPQEGGVPLVLSSASPTPLVTQAAGVMQSTITATQQPLPVFRQPTGVHLPHYPPNYIPYGPYFSPFYVPPPAIHQFLSNGAFPQQPQAGSLYPTAPGTTAKYSVSQYKQGTNTGSSTLGVPGNYGPYGLSMANYTSSSATAAVSSTSNEDVSAPQVKESNVYVSGQQNEGSGVWFTTHSRDISTLQASSFYNLPQGQLAFTPTQPGHGTFTGIFHPAQAVTAANVHPLLQQSQAITNPVDMVGPTASVYQQPQHAQLNWPSNY